jgi:ferredoxin
MMPDGIAVEVDHDRCYGAQNCRLVAPGAFRYDVEGKAVPDDVPAAPLEELQLAAAQCPATAITVAAQTLEE